MPMPKPIQTGQTPGGLSAKTVSPNAPINPLTEKVKELVRLAHEQGDHL
jgi:hypothetical protein